MNTLTRIALLPACFILFLDACTLQDHRPGPQNPDCQLLSMTITSKTSYGPRLQKDEILEVDGQQIPIGKERSYKYTFDEQNRLIESHLLTYTGSFGDSRITFAYSPNWVTTNQYRFGSPGSEGEEKLPLNDQGLLAKPNLTYDAEGFLINDSSEYGPSKYFIENGNIVRIERYEIPSEGNAIVSVETYEFDLTKPGVPNTEPYKGKASKNLLTKRTMVLYDFHGTVVSATYVSDYKYFFDGAGRPIRQYTEFIESNVKYYGVVDYSYTCRD